MAESIEKIGKLLDGSEGRDAVHIAILPATSDERLSPSDRVGLTGTRKSGPNGEEVVVVSSRKRPVLGIVDPYLPNREIELGCIFWVFLIPQTITSLRHVWTHPAFTENKG